ncbi:MAG: HIT family protein [Nocardioidaceae bacterium]
MPASCLFCAIASGEVPAALVIETDDVVGFLDHRPLFKGHTLIVPRAHHVTLTDLPAELLTSIFTAAQRLAAVMPAELDAQGTFVAMNNIVSQSVAHAHVHVVPRTKGDGLRGFFWPRTKYAEGEAEEHAARLRAAYGA